MVIKTVLLQKRGLLGFALALGLVLSPALLPSKAIAVTAAELEQKAVDVEAARTNALENLEGMRANAIEIDESDGPFVSISGNSTHENAGRLTGSLHIA